MDGQARVGSIDAIQDFRAALIRYAERARRALDDVTGEVKRTRGWLESEQRQKWEGEYRRRARHLEQAQQELFSARLSSMKQDKSAQQMAVKKAERKGKPVRGASTITNQCARSIFLWQGRSWIRKGLESYYTIWMEALLPKRRILELYANVIEMGPGIYGVEAASQHYFRVSARGLTREQSAMLAAVLPNPKGWDPTNPGRTLRRRQRRILQRERNAHFPERLLH